jgi:hypothetical protein
LSKFVFTRTEKEKEMNNYIKFIEIEREMININHIVSIDIDQYGRTRAYISDESYRTYPGTPEELIEEINKEPLVK